MLFYTWCVGDGYYAYLARCSGQSIAATAGLRVAPQGCLAEHEWLSVIVDSMPFEAKTHLSRVIGWAKASTTLHT